VLATEGARGASVQLEDGSVVTAGITPDPRPIVDTMGAGDACLAAAADAIARRGAPRTAAEGEAMLRTCMAIAAATCREQGALLRMPTA
jgi:fructokinase